MTAIKTKCRRLPVSNFRDDLQGGSGGKKFARKCQESLTKTGTKTSLANGSLKAERNTLECSYLGILQFLDIHPLQEHKQHSTRIDLGRPYRAIAFDNNNEPRPSFGKVVLTTAAAQPTTPGFILVYLWHHLRLASPSLLLANKPLLMQAKISLTRIFNVISTHL